MKSLGKALILFLLIFMGAWALGYYSGVLISGATGWLGPNNGILLLLLTVPIIPAAGLYVFIRVRKKNLVGTISEEERMLEPFYEVDAADKVRVVMSVFLLGSLFVVIVYLVTSGLIEPWRSIAIWSSLGLLLLIVVTYGLMFFQKTRLHYERLELYMIPAGMYGLSVLFMFFMIRIEDLPLPGSIHFGNIAITLFSIGALFSGVKLLLVANRSIYDKKAKAEEELNFASEVQQQFLSDRIVDTNSASGFGMSRAARQVGGDFLYLEESKDQSIVAAVGDVSGHSFGAGLIMSMLITMTEDHMEFRKSPAGLMENLNRKLLNQPKRHLFATMLCIRLDEDGATIWNAGHMPVLKYSPAEQELTKIQQHGFALGMTKQAEYKAIDVPLKRGDVLILYSDGLIETRDEKGQIRDEEHFYLKVKSIVEEQSNCKQIANSVLDKILKDDHNRYPEDDLTIVVLKQKG